MTITAEQIDKWRADREERVAAFGAILNRGEWRYTESLCRDNHWQYMDWEHPATRKEVRRQIEIMEDDIKRMIAMKERAEKSLTVLEDEIKEHGEFR